MNTTIIAIVTFSIGLAFGGAFFGVCNSKAIDYQDYRYHGLGNSLLEQESARQEQEHRYWQQQKQNNLNRYPCP